MAHFYACSGKLKKKKLRKPKLPCVDFFKRTEHKLEAKGIEFTQVLSIQFDAKSQSR